MRRVVDVPVLSSSTFEFPDRWESPGNVNSIFLEGGWAAYVAKYRGGTLIYIPGVAPPIVRIWDRSGPDEAQPPPDTGRGERRPQLDEGGDE